MSTYDAEMAKWRKPATRMQFGVITERIVLATTILCLIICVVNGTLQAQAYSTDMDYAESSFAVWVVFYNFTVPLATLIFHSIIVSLHWSTKVIGAVELASTVAASGLLAAAWLAQVILWSICTGSIFSGDNTGVCLQPKLLAAHNHNRQDTLLALFVPQPFMLTFGAVIIAEFVYYIYCGIGAIKQEKERQARKSTTKVARTTVTWNSEHVKQMRSRFSADSSVL